MKQGLSSDTFGHRYCELHGITTDRFASHFFARCLHPHARPIAPLIKLFNRQFFASDFDTVADIAGCRSLQEMHAAIAEYRYHPYNRGWARDWLRIRISSRRIMRHGRQFFRSRSSGLAPVSG
ncbi:hypothetical protein PXH66_07985 [Synoicihabitans lomoniglobus]|uniref:Uncharacterized protein n=1 Tax=Synoicihabitans lomoniglobus TaxID=2909285 RepID=A0AAF0CRN8_9BACT|nr:hypothetical protein PXH66_07985 [Opitutaceae bacterium LMO-M01]